MTTDIHRRVGAARSGTNPAVICRVQSGWAVLCDLQFLRGYSLLLPDPVVADLNELNRQQRSEYLCDMALIGDALLEVTGAYRINYAILGNSDPALHAHIVPRYLSEPEPLRKLPPWFYPKEQMDALKFDRGRDQNLISLIADAIKKRL